MGQGSRLLLLQLLNPRDSVVMIKTPSGSLHHPLHHHFMHMKTHLSRPLLTKQFLKWHFFFS